MRILLIGATGTLGGGIQRELGQRHDIVTASRTRGEIRVDITNSASIAAMYQLVGAVDAVVSAVGEVYFGSLAKVTYDEFMIGVKSKLMGQVDLVLQGFEHVREGGSFTLTSGITERDPVRGFANASMVNAALGGFVLGASVEMPRGQRINVVSPGLLAESVQRFGSYFPGHVPVPASVVAMAFAKSVEGGINGQKIVV